MSLPARLAANVAWLFTEQPWLDRFAAAVGAGFAAVEFPWPEDPDATVTAVGDAGIRVALLNMDAGDLGAGERGWPNDPGRVTRWRADMQAAFELAERLDCRVINVLAGNDVPGVPREVQLETLERNLLDVLPEARARGVTLATELLNRAENPEYLLATLDDAEPLLERLAPLGWRLQLDTWHLALTEPDVPTAIRRAGDRIGHVQLADAPGRHEPGSGSLDWQAIRAALEEAGYAGAIGLEYRPRSGTLEGLSESSVLAGWLTAR